MLTNLSPIDKVSIVALGKKIESDENTGTICALASKLGVSLMSESRHRDRLLEKLTRDAPAPPSSAVPRFAKLIIAQLLERSLAVNLNDSRQSYALWFKDFIVDLKARDRVTYNELSEALQISVETLSKFSTTLPDICCEHMDVESEKLSEIWNSAPPERRKNLDAFWYFLGKKHQGFSISFKKMRQTLINLGLHRPRGPRTKDHGTNVKKSFEPHALWEGDGKQVNLSINGHRETYLWYAFVEQETTLLVGSNIERSESSANFLSALKKGEKSANTYPIGILIDNRLSDEELSPIRKWCRSHNIVIVRTFPGNSKSNGNIENNFSIFERFVGDIAITGSTPAEISKSISQVIVEIFTQLRNHQDRARLNGRTPEGVCKDAKRPEHVRDDIEKMAARFQRQEDNGNEKWELIANARAQFEALSERSEIKIKKIIVKYPTLDIVAAQSAYLAQIAKYPNEKYRSEYFMAILRHKRETKAKDVYNEVYRAGILKSNVYKLDGTLTKEMCATNIVEAIAKMQDELTPAHRMLKLDSLAWWMVSNVHCINIKQLWQVVCDSVTRMRKISLRFWQLVNEYMVDRIGGILFCEINQEFPHHSNRQNTESIRTENLC